LILSRQHPHGRNGCARAREDSPLISPTSAWAQRLMLLTGAREGISPTSAWAQLRKGELLALRWYLANIRMGATMWW